VKSGIKFIELNGIFQLVNCPFSIYISSGMRICDWTEFPVSSSHSYKL
jgi:hypothetical protein